VVRAAGDALCSRSLPLYRGFKRRFRGQEEDLESEDFREAFDEQDVHEVDARCWAYLEHRFEALAIKRREQRARRARVVELRAKLDQARCTSESTVHHRLRRVPAEHAQRLQELVRSAVHSIFASKVLAKFENYLLPADDLGSFLVNELKLQPTLWTSRDSEALGCLLRTETGVASIQTLLDFAEHGLDMIPSWRLISPSEQRARAMIEESFGVFLRRREAEMACQPPPVSPQVSFKEPSEARASRALAVQRLRDLSAAF